MRNFPLTLLIACLPFWSLAQQTLIKGAVNDTFYLSCAACSTEVYNMGVFQGTPTLPYNLQKTDMPNLLHWRHFNGILGRDMITDRELSWEQCTQLLDDVKNDEMLSLHINLIWEDSTGLRHRLNLMASGLRKENLVKLPIYADYTTEVGAPERFVAIAQLRFEGDRTETYEIVDGFLEIDEFDLKKSTIKGRFEFNANCYGLIKTGFFSQGVFQRL